MYRVLFSRKAEKSLQKIPKDYQRKVKNAINSLSVDPRRFGVIRISGVSKADKRLRVGEYRILFKINDDKKAVIIGDIKRRTTTTYRH